MTIANAAIRSKGNQDLRKVRKQPTDTYVGTAPFLPPAQGVGRRSLWPYPPIGEAQRRDPHIGDPVPNPPHANSSQANASPSVRKVGDFASGGGSSYTGLPPTTLYIKQLGQTITKTLARALLAGTVDAGWRLGGVSLPFDQWGLGYGMGYQGDAQSLWFDNPQTYLRNPGIKPITSVPATYRYVNIVGTAPVGPSIADVGNTPAPGQ